MALKLDSKEPSSRYFLSWLGRVEVDHEDAEERLQTVEENEESREGNGRVVKVNLCADTIT
jgi:hypothetical protein